jgi:hypothetical protein
LIGTSNQGAKAFDTQTGTYKDILTYNPDKTEIFVRNFVQTGPDEIWIATESGISSIILKQVFSPISRKNIMIVIPFLIMRCIRFVEIWKAGSGQGLFWRH